MMRLKSPTVVSFALFAAALFAHLGVIHPTGFTGGGW